MWRWGQNEDSAYQRNGRESLGIGIVAQSTANPGGGPGHREEARGDAALPAGGAARPGRLRLHHLHQTGHRRGIQRHSPSAPCWWWPCSISSSGRAHHLIPAIGARLLISAFIGAWYLGFSINLITLLALILAIGLVVDDAIVVVENIHHHLQQGESP